jgi:hypothetical protein
MAVSFPGTAGVYLVQAAGSGGTPSMTNVTICGWARLDADRNALSNICSLQSVAPGFSYIGISTDSDGTTLVGQTEGLSTTVLSLAVNDIFFWAFSCSGAGTNTFTAYAAKIGDSALTSVTINVADVADTDGLLTFGDNAYSEPFNGVIDNIIIFDSLLSAQELEQQRWKRVPVKAAWAWYPLLGPTFSDSLVDFSGNNRTINGSTPTPPTQADSLPFPWGARALLISQPLTLQTGTAITDSNVSGWTSNVGGSLFAAIDETSPADTDFIYTSTNSTARFKLTSLLDPQTLTGHTLSYRIQSLTSGNMRVKLYQSGGTTISAGTLIVTYTHAPAPTSFTTYNQTLTSGEVDSITDYTDLYVEFEKY